MIETNVAKSRSTLIKVELLDMQERPVGSVEGQVISGNITVDGNSILRRVANLSFITTDDNYRILETSNSISISKKIRISIGERDLDDQSPTKWFSMGVFLLTGFSSSANVNSQTISISAKDKMAMHNGDVSGKVKHGVRVDSEFENESVKRLYETMSKNFDVALEAKDSNTEEFKKLSKLVDEMYNEMAGVNYEMESTLVRMKNKLSVAKLLEGIEYRRQMRELRADMALLSTNSGRNKLTIREIVRYAATSLAGELPGKVIVADIPDKIKTPVMLPDGRVGFRMIKYVYPEELTLNTGQPVTAIYEACKNALGGNYEYFYDVDGNFVFQEIKNYKYNNIVDVDEISPQEYRVSHDRTPIQIDFSGTDIITSYSNRPDPQNIKNDFHVWGSNGSDTIGYHLVIDDRPYVPNFVKDINGESIDWREYLVYNRDVGPNVEFIGKMSSLENKPPFNQYNGRPPVALYVDPDGDKWERKFVIYKGGKWQPYDPEPPIGTPSEYYSEIKHIWMPDRFYPDGSRIENRADYSYHFDIIEGSKDLDRFSVKTIGRRGEPIEDKSIRQVYPTKIEDILIYYDEKDLEHTRNKDQAIKVDTPKDFAKYPPAGNVYRDAFTTIKQMLFKHTTYNEQVAITSLPLYEMEVNRRNYIEYDRASIRGLYLSTKISFNFDENSLMNVNFIRVNPIEQ